MKKVYTITRKHITNDPQRQYEQSIDNWSIMYESLKDANKALVAQADQAFSSIKNKKSSYRTVATAGKSKVAVVGYMKNGYYYENDFVIDEYFFQTKDS